MSLPINYEVDALGRLKYVDISGVDELDYQMDSSGRRVSRYVNGVLESHYLYESDLRVAGEYNPTTTVFKEYIYNTSLNSPEYMKVGASKYRIIKDHLGSPILVVKSDTGVVEQRLSYTEFGEITTDTNPEFQMFGFAGGIYDQVTKLTRFGARDYDAETGRWTSKDPIRFNGGDTNLYGYVLRDPVNFTDPTGLDRRRCSRRLNKSFIPKVGVLRHDYVEFRDSSGNTTQTSWGPDGMIDESRINTSTRTCGDWQQSSDAADRAARNHANRLSITQEYGLFNYNCQHFSTEIMGIGL